MTSRLLLIFLVFDLVLMLFNSHEKARNAIFYSYDRHINGFAAVLEEEEAEAISSNSKLSFSLLSLFESLTFRVFERRASECDQCVSRQGEEVAYNTFLGVHAIGEGWCDPVKFLVVKGKTW